MYYSLHSKRVYYIEILWLIADRNAITLVCYLANWPILTNRNATTIVCYITLQIVTTVHTKPFAF